MATAGVNRMMLWTDLEGRELEGGWRLTRLVRPEGRNAWFAGAGQDGKPVMLSVTEALNDEDELLERLRAAAEIRHRNVVEVREAFLSNIDDTPVVAAVMEPTEENLADVLRERALDAGEARQVLDAVLAGLAAIHARGLVHGRMEAASVLATGDTIKLRSDCLHIAEAKFAAGAAENVRCVGRIVTQAMTRRQPANENDPVLQLLPEPMARAVRRALSGNASTSEVAALAGTRLEVAARTATRKSEILTPAPATETPRPEIVPPAVRRDAATIVPSPDAGAAMGVPAKQDAAEAELPAAEKSEPLSVESGNRKAVPTSAPASDAEEQVRAEQETEDLPLFSQRGRSFLLHEATPIETAHLFEDDEPRPDRRRSAPYVIGVAAVLVIVTIFALHALLHRRTTPAASSPEAVVVQRPANRAKPAASATAKPTEVTARGGPAAAAPGWRVVVYTYNREAEAAHKARELAARHPQLHPAVFSPRGRTSYLVTLGGVMTRSQAIALRARALRMGMPRDTYARNYR